MKVTKKTPRRGARGGVWLVSPGCLGKAGRYLKRRALAKGKKKQKPKSKREQEKIKK